MDLSKLSDEELLRLAGQAASNQQAVAPSSLAHLSDEELLKMSEAQPEPSLTDKALDYGKNALNAAGRVLNIVPSTAKALTLGTLSEGVGKLRGKDETEYLKELAKAMTGEGVPSEEYFRRMGWDSEKNVEPVYGHFGALPGSGRSLRENVGAVTDLAYDFIAPEVAGAKLQQVGKALYQKPFARMNKIASAEGKVAPGEIFWKEGKTPLTQGGIQEGAEDIIAARTASRNALEKPLLESTQTGSIDSALASARAKIEQLNNSGSVYDRQLGAKLEKDLNAQSALFDKSQPTYSQLMDIKKGAGSSVKWGGESGSRSEDAFLKALGGGARKESYSIANKVDPSLGEKIHAANQDISSLISILPEAERKALVEAGKHGITEVDAMLALHPEILLPKQAGKILKTPGFKTVTGRAVHNAGKAIRPSTYGNILKKLGE